MSLPGSSRWCPTPEQLMILEEIYRGGIRTPKAFQIQKITVHLSLYGKIEGKNVFYWFQNHKARDRQKLRRKQLFLAKQQQLQQQHHRHHYLHSPLALHHHHHHPPNSYHSSPPFRHLGGGVEDDSSSTLLKHYTWKTNIPAERCQEKIINRLYGQDHWMTMIGVGPTSPPPCCNRTPLKTLQLFPTTSSSSTTTSSNPSKVELELSIDS